jgi:hypothetical protein
VSRAVVTKDASHWLYQLTPDEWVGAATRELRQAEAAFASKKARAGIAGVRRAAGMALNARLILEPNEAWGRSYMEHLIAIKAGQGSSLPARIIEACTLLVETPIPGGELTALRTKTTDERLLEAARDVIADAYAIVLRSTRGEVV